MDYIISFVLRVILSSNMQYCSFIAISVFKWLFKVYGWLPKAICSYFPSKTILSRKAKNLSMLWFTSNLFTRSKYKHKTEWIDWCTIICHAHCCSLNIFARNVCEVLNTISLYSLLCEFFTVTVVVYKMFSIQNQ